jgi:hypothetical protein
MGHSVPLALEALGFYEEGTVGQWVIPYRYGWESEPSDRDVFRTLDGSLVDLQNETPPGRG